MLAAGRSPSCYIVGPLVSYGCDVGCVVHTVPYRTGGSIHSADFSIDPLPSYGTIDDDDDDESTNCCESILGIRCVGGERTKIEVATRKLRTTPYITTNSKYIGSMMDPVRVHLQRYLVQPVSRRFPTLSFDPFAVWRNEE